VIDDDVEFACAGLDGGAGFLKLLVRVLCAFVKTYDAGYDDRGALEVGDTARDPWETNADAL